ncbi:MAG: sodium/solute symporter [Kiritimatiellae bacterium]|nr:sodium/solute symporter [Kiritimatiellia bacterium]
MRHILTAALSALSVAAFAGSPVEFEWKPRQTIPVKVARPFGGFMPDGSFLVAGGTTYDKAAGLKDYERGIYLLSPGEGKCSGEEIGKLPDGVGFAEGVSASVPSGLFCAGGGISTNDQKRTAAFILSLTEKDGRRAVEVKYLPPLPEAISKGAAAADIPEPRPTGDNPDKKTKVYVVGHRKVYMLDLTDAKKWEEVAEVPGGVDREEIVAAIQNGDQKKKMLVVYGGYDIATRQPLTDGHRLVLETKEWRDAAPLESVNGNLTAIGSSLLPSGHQFLLLAGGYGKAGWIRRDVEKDYSVDDAAGLGWNRKIYAYNCVTDAWCEYGEIDKDDKPRCGAAAGILTGKTPEQYSIFFVGGEEAPMTRTDLVSVASFKKTGKFGATAWAVVGVYALLMVGMAVYFIRKKKDENDYFRGGNRIPWYVAGMSIFATMLSSITFIAIPTQAYLQDWRYFIMAFFIIGMAPVAIYYYLPFFCRLGITSAYEYLEKRFNLGVRLFGSAAFIVFMVCRVAVVTLLPAIALNAVTGISIDACILICGVLTMVYCSLGGLEAVIWSDFVQGIVLMGGAVAVLVLLVLKTGADGAHFSTFWSVAGDYGKNKMWDFRFLLSEPVFWVVAVQGLVSNLSSYTSDQCVIQRYIATPDENATKRSLWFNGCMSVFAQIVFYGIGMALFAFYHTNPQAADVSMMKGDSILPTFMATEMPAWLAGLVIAAVFAATISTLSANLSSASTAVVTDFVKRFKPGISGKAQIRCGQITTYVIGIIGILSALTLARMESNALFDNFNKYIAMLTAGLTGLFFMGVFMPRIKGIAAVLGLAANYFVCFSCEILDCNVFGLKFHPFLLGGLGLVACILVSTLASFVLKEGGRDLSGLTIKTLKKDK